MHQPLNVANPPAWFIVCDTLCIELEDLAHIIKEEPATIRSWFANPDAFKGNYFDVDNSPVHNSLAKYKQLLAVAEHIKALNELLGCEKKVFVLLNRPRKKLRGKSFATIAKSSPNPMPVDNGFQEMLEKLQAWCDRKEIVLPDSLARV